MNLVYLYGPPAVGKLTVAKELPLLTSYRVFHNHLTIDCITPVFEFGSEVFWELVHGSRLAVIEEAARQGVDLIYTSVYVPRTTRSWSGAARRSSVTAGASASFSWPASQPPSSDGSRCRTGRRTARS